MATKKAPSKAQLAARKKFVEMVRAKSKAKKSATTHKDTKSHNVNIRVVSGIIGSLPFTGVFLGVKISARSYYDGIKIDVGTHSFNYYKGNNTSVLSENIAKVIENKQKQYQEITQTDHRKILSKIKLFVSSLKNEFPKVLKSTIKKLKSKKLEDNYTNKSIRQTGTSNKVKDSMRKALPPGKRKSKTGKLYTERRTNRSDKPGSLTGVNFNSKKYALSAYEKQLVYIRNIESTILKIKTALPNMKTAHWKVELKKELAQTKKLLIEYKQHAKELKKLL